jgi:hypothetical protein
LLRSQGAAVLLETERLPADAIALATTDRRNGVIVVGAGLTLHDIAAGTAAEVDRKTLTRLARDLAEDGRR